MDSHDSPRKSREMYCRPARRKPSPRVRKRSPSRPRAERRRGSPRTLPSLPRKKNAKQRKMWLRESGGRGDPRKLPGRKLPEQSQPPVSAFASSRDLGKQFHMGRPASWEHGLPRSNPGSIPETADERSPGFQPLLCQRPCKFIERRVVLGIEVVPAENRDVIGGEDHIPVGEAFRHLSEDARAQLRLEKRRPGPESPPIRERIHQLGLEASVNASLAGQLAVVVHDRVEGLGEIGGVMRGENRVAVRFLPTPALKGFGQSQREALNLPN